MSAYKQQSKNITKTWFLVFAFVGLVSSICFILSAYYGNYSIAIIGFAIAIGQSLIGYFAGDKLVLSSVRAKQVTTKESPKIVDMVQNLAKIADIPVPKIYISPDKSANAFATGRNPQNASICLNQGILNLLDKNELEGVIAHELAHVKNRDILIMTMTSVLSSVISIIVDIGFRMTFFGFGRSNSDDDNQSPLVFIVYIVLMIAAPILSLLISMSISRQREYLADATAVTITRYPNGLINALQKLYKSPTPADNYSSARAHFYISPPKKSFGEKSKSWFSTHPSIEDRVKALRDM